MQKGRHPDRSHSTHPQGGLFRRGRILRALVLLGVAVVAFAGGAVFAGSPQPTRPPPQTAESPAPSPDQGEPAEVSGKPFRAFVPDSWWNAPLPDDVPLHPDATEILDYMRTAPENGGGCLQLAGADNDWGQPIYWAGPGDPMYDVKGVKYDRPAELSRMRIPEGALPADNSDGSMTIYDLEWGYVTAFTDARYDEDEDAWRASGATVTYLDSNGLHVATGRSDDPRNRGTHRGNNGATMAVAWDQVQAGEIRHVLKVAAGPETADRYVFPMVGSDGDYVGDDPAVPPQGLRFRIKPSVDLERMRLAPEARVIARALQSHGFYIGDSGGTTALKLEDTATAGRGDLWNVARDALCGLPFTDEHWDVVAEGYDPSDPAGR